MSANEKAKIAKRNLIELVCVLLTGIGHVALELSCDGMTGAAERLNRPQHFFNLAAVVAWGAYLFWCFFSRAIRAGDVGFRREGFLGSLKTGLWLLVPGMIAMIAIGLKTGMVSGVSAGFWVLLPIYPIWGLAQQFALQVLVARNLEGVLQRPSFRALVAGFIFSMAHFPTFMLMALTFPAGVLITWIFARYRNIWAAGILHGFLGATAYYFILGQDPGLQLLEWIQKVVS